MSKYSGCILKRSAPTYSAENGKLHEFCYNLEFTLTDLKSRSIVQGDVVKSTAFYLGNNDEHEANVLVYPKGKCHGSCNGSFCVFIAHAPAIAGQTVPRGGATFSIKGCKYENSGFCLWTAPLVDDWGLSCDAEWGLPGDAEWGASSPQCIWKRCCSGQLDEHLTWGCCSKFNFIYPFETLRDLTIIFKLTIAVEVVMNTCVFLPSQSKVSNDMKENFGHLLESGDFSDVTLIADGKKCNAHKLILAARSPIFKTMFQTEMLENKSNVVELSDIDFETVQSLVNYMYTDEVLNIDMLGESLLYAAEKYQMEGLKTKCEEALSKNLTVENAARIFVLSDLHSADDLKNKVTIFINKNGNKVFKTDEWKKVKEEYPKAVLSSFL